MVNRKIKNFSLNIYDFCHMMFSIKKLKLSKEDLYQEGMNISRRKSRLNCLKIPNIHAAKNINLGVILRHHEQQKNHKNMST